MEKTAPQNLSVEIEEHSDDELIRALEILAARLHSDERIWWDEKAINALQGLAVRLYLAGVLTKDQLFGIPHL